MVRIELDGVSETRAFVGTVARRLALRGVLTFVLWTFAAGGIAAMAVGVWARSLGPSAALGMVLAASLLAAVFFATLRATADLRACRGRATAARYVASTSPALGDDIRTTLALASASDGESFSRALAAAHAKRTASLIKPVSPSTIVPWAPLRMRVLIFCLVGVIAVSARAVFQPATYSVAILLGLRDPSVEEAEAPLLSDIKIVLAYPAYSRRARATVTGASGDIRALRGTEVTFEGRPRAPLSRAIFRLPGATVVASLVEGEGQELLRAHFVVTDAGPYTLEATVGHRRLRDRPYRLDLEPDVAPLVELAAPDEAIELAPYSRVPFAFRASDDFGLTSLELVWKAPGKSETRLPVTVTPALAENGTTREAIGQDDWELMGSGLEPGAAVSYWLEARDNDTVSGPKVGRSRTFALRLESPEQKHDRALLTEQQVLEQMIDLLGDRLEMSHSPVDAEVRGIHQRFAALLDLLGAARNHVGVDVNALFGLRERLNAIYGRLEKLFHQEETTLADLARFAAQVPRQVGELEGDVLELDNAVDRQQLDRLRDLAAQVSSARARLRDLLKQYAKTHDENVLREALRLLAEVQNRWQEIAARVARLRGQMPEEFLNHEVVRAVDLGAEIHQARERLSQGDVAGALAALEAMQGALDKLAASLDEGFDQMSHDRFAAEERIISEVADKLTDLEATERNIAKEAGELAETQRRTTEDALRNRTLPQARRAIARVDELAQRIRDVQREALSPFGQEQLDQAWQRIEETRHALEEGVPQEALESARQAAQAVEMTRDEAMDTLPYARPDRRAAARENVSRLTDAAPLARSIVEDLERAMSQAAESLAPDAKRALLGLATRQQEARRRTSELARQIGRQTQEAPALEAMRGALENVGGVMERAGGKMQAGQPREGFERSSEAAERLAELVKELHNRGRGGQGRMGQGQGMARQHVRIPGAEEYRPPREWRQEILDAMKEKAPATFRDQVRRYYQELVR